MDERYGFRVSYPGVTGQGCGGFRDSSSGTEVDVSVTDLRQPVRVEPF